MTKLTTIDTIALDTVTGGQNIFTPCARLDNLTLKQIRDEGKEAGGKDLAQANWSCGVPLPTAKQKRDAKHIYFLNAR